MNGPGKRAGELFESGLYCAESVLLALAEHKGVKNELIPRMATGFCGGVSRTGGMCGALSGAIMAVNMIHGRNSPDQTVDEAYARVGELVGMFKQRFGSILCPDLAGCDLGTEQGREFFRANDIKNKKCMVFAEGAANMALEVI